MYFRGPAKSLKMKECQLPPDHDALALTHALQVLRGRSHQVQLFVEMPTICARSGVPAYDPKPKYGLAKRTSNRTFNREPIGMTREIPS